MVEEEDQRDRETKGTRELTKDKQGRALDKFLDWIAFTGQPLSTSNDPYFIRFYKELNDQVDLPGRKGTTTLLVNVKFRLMYQKLLALLDRVRTIHSTTDMWSNFRLRSSFIGFTGHMYDPLTKSRVTVRLALRPFNSSHTALNIIEEATKIFKELGIMHKVKFGAFLISKSKSILFQIQYVNSDNGANIKRALLDMGKMEMTLEEEPLIVVDEDDDWTKIAKADPSGVTTAIEDEVDFAPCPISPQDEFYPVGLEEEQVWDSGDYSDVASLIQNLEDKVANIIANPRINNLQRLPCICHTLQVRTFLPFTYTHQPIASTHHQSLLITL